MNYVITDGIVRKLWGSDAEAYGDHLLRLDAASRRNRFGGCVADDFIRRHAAGAFEPENVIYGFLADGILRGAAELRPLGPNAGRAEAAFSIERSWQSHGVGTELLERTLLAARNRGISNCTSPASRRTGACSSWRANSMPNCGATTIASSARSKPPTRRRCR